MRIRSVIFMAGVVLLASGYTTLWNPENQTANQPPSFRILTHNVFTVLGATGIDPRIELIGAGDYMRGYDTVIVEELFNDEASAHLTQALHADYPYWTPVIGRSDTPITPDCAANTCWSGSVGHAQEMEDGGVAILSKWPIRERRQIFFETSCNFDGYASKGFVYARLDMNGLPVHVIGTHMQADPSDLGPLAAQVAALRPCPPPEAYPVSATCPGDSQTPYEAVRLAQLMQIDAWITAQAIPADEMIIIGGDLNVDKVGNPAEYARMLCVLNVSEPAFGANPAMPAPHYTWDTRLNGLLSPEIESPLYVDYLLVRRDHLQPAAWFNNVIYASPFPATWDSARARGYEYSDHFPVAGYSDPASAPPPITTRLSRCAPGEIACDAVCPAGFTAAEWLCIQPAK